MKNKNKRPSAIAGTTKTLHNADGIHVGSVTEYTDGTFLGYFAPIGVGEFRASRRAAERFVEDTDGDVSYAHWQAA